MSQATYNYLADCYQQYSSSAQAAQSLLRGILGACFPFFGIIMVCLRCTGSLAEGCILLIEFMPLFFFSPFFKTQYDDLTFRWASSLVGFVALGFAAVPFLVYRCTSACTFVFVPKLTDCYFWITVGPAMRARSRVALRIAQEESAPISDEPATP